MYFVGVALPHSIQAIVRNLLVGKDSSNVLHCRRCACRCIRVNASILVVFDKQIGLAEVRIDVNHLSSRICFTCLGPTEEFITGSLRSGWGYNSFVDMKRLIRSNNRFLGIFIVAVPGNMRRSGILSGTVLRTQSNGIGSGLDGFAIFFVLDIGYPRVLVIHLEAVAREDHLVGIHVSIRRSVPPLHDPILECELCFAFFGRGCLTRRLSDGLGLV